MNLANRLGGITLAACAALWATIAVAQPKGPEPFEETGVVVAVAPNMIQLLSEKQGMWIIQFDPRQTKIAVTGTAEAAFLRPGIFVKFSGEMDKKGALKSDITDLEITAMSKTSGIFASGSDEKSKPVAKLEDGTYDVRGRVATYKDGEIVITAGPKKVTGKVASDAKLAVNAADVSFAQKDDTIKVSGFADERYKPDPAKSQPGQAMAKEITITLAKPLTAIAKKSPTKPLKGKGKLPADGETPAAGGANADPFGFEKAAGKK